MHDQFYEYLILEHYFLRNKHFTRQRNSGAGSLMHAVVQNIVKIRICMIFGYELHDRLVMIHTRRYESRYYTYNALVCECLHSEIKINNV